MLISLMRLIFMITWSSACLWDITTTTPYSSSRRSRSWMRSPSLWSLRIRASSAAAFPPRGFSVRLNPTKAEKITPEKIEAGLFRLSFTSNGRPRAIAHCWANLLCGDRTPLLSMLNHCRSATPVAARRLRESATRFSNRLYPVSLKRLHTQPCTPPAACQPTVQVRRALWGVGAGEDKLVWLALTCPACFCNARLKSL